MQPISFPEKNFTFGKPADMTDAECSSLDVWKGEVPTLEGRSFPAIISCWELSDEDIANIVKYRKLWPCITGHGMPPISFYTENPFIQS